MSAYSTLYITRSKALELYAKLQAPSNAELERFLDEKLESQLRRITIIPDEAYRNDNYTAETCLNPSNQLWPS